MTTQGGSYGAIKPTPEREPLLENSRDLRIHLRAWDDGQEALCRTLLRVAPFVDDLVPIIESLRRKDREEGPR